MASTIKVLSNTVAANTTNNNIFSARNVYLLANGAQTITIFDTVSGAQVGSFKMAAGQSIVVSKKPTDVIQTSDATSNCAATSVAITN